MSFRLLPRVLESHAYLGATISFSVDTLRRSTWLFNSCLLYYPWSLVKKVAFITKVISLIILFLMIKRGAFSHPKFGMNLARLSQAMFCTLWLSKRHIHLYKLSWNSTPQSWNDSCDFFFNSIFSHIWILYISRSNAVLESLWLACTSFHSWGKQMNAEI